MEVKPDYKQTAMGVIPEEWEVKHLKNISPRISGRLVYQPAQYFVDQGVPFLMANNVTERGIRWEDVKFIPDKINRFFSQHALKEGDVVTVRVGTPGVTCVVPKEADGLNCGSMMIIRRHPSFDSHWLCCAMNSNHGRRQVEHIQYGTAQKQINICDAVDFCYPVPPLPEQRAIAMTLSDVDALLGALDRLIAKKRDLKQAAMQQLLTGQTRLPGFHGEWEVKTLGELATVTKGSQLHNSETNDEGQFPHLNGGMFASSYTDKANTPADTIAISEGGNSCGYVQFMSRPYWCGGHCYAVVPKNTDNRFLYHALKGQQTAVMALRVGSGLPNVQKTALAAFKLHLPSDLPEQAAIAGVLSELDVVLAVLEQRQAKTRALKQGMMQALLTGKVRLPVDREPATLRPTNPA